MNILERGHLASGWNISIDPGNIGSGWVIWQESDTQLGNMKIYSSGQSTNVEIRKFLSGFSNFHTTCTLSIECPKPSGMAVAAELMETMIQIGRILQMWRGPLWTYIFRPDVKMCLCGSMRAKDPNVRQAIIDRFGGDSLAIGGKKCEVCKGKGEVGKARCPKCLLSKQTGNTCKHCACGTNKSVYEKEPCSECEGSGFETRPGPLSGVSSHVWAALGVAICWMDSDRDVRHSIAGQQNLKGQKKKWKQKTRTSKGVPLDDRTKKS